ncbi:hypothetical protein [Natronoglomus mannanivorans]|uniref:Uncharacterized protein n=1 Tax=Natronoglomus mannanivorans TaxID=2979990 RepID=A0AAP3E173_9EURY|nr:hypothetical protein [Halobacteria archaeon AArc-xg1-1]
MTLYHTEASPGLERDERRGHDQDQKALREQVERVQLRLEQVERTLSAVANETAGIQIAGPCTRCERSLLVMRDNSFTCPTCQYQRSI